VSVEERSSDGAAAASDVWNSFVPDAGSPGFSLRTTYPTNPDGVEVMLERWAAGTGEPPHFHPGDDMTIVVEGMMSTQRYRREGDALVTVGEPVVLRKGDVGYIRAGQIHDATYVEACQLVYVHNGAFGFIRAEGEVD
jgi:quercetin dioxygenase-like cupin family protein